VNASEYSHGYSSTSPTDGNVVRLGTGKHARARERSSGRQIELVPERLNTRDEKPDDDNRTADVASAFALFFFPFTVKIA